MVRFDASSAAVLGLAVACSLSVAFWMNREASPGLADAAAPIPAEVIAPVSGQPGQIVKSADGHYWAEADINGRAVRVMVDTGASAVALTLDDARRLGVLPDPSAFTRTVQTASGPVKAAPVELDHVRVAGARVEKVEALVLEAGLPHALLGMSFLGRLSAFEATPHTLTLRP